MIYQTPAHRVREAEILARCGRAWGRTVEQNPDEMDCFDGYGYKPDVNRVVAVIEVKDRALLWGQFRSIFVAQRKVQRLLACAAFFDARPLFVVASEDDVLGWADLTPAPTWPARDRARTRDVRCATDLAEVVVEVPVAAFRVVNEDV